MRLFQVLWHNQHHPVLQYLLVTRHNSRFLLLAVKETRKLKRKQMSHRARIYKYRWKIGLGQEEQCFFLRKKKIPTTLKKNVWFDYSVAMVTSSHELKCPFLGQTPTNFFKRLSSEIISVTILGKIKHFLLCAPEFSIKSSASFTVTSIVYVPVAPAKSELLEGRNYVLIIFVYPCLHGVCCLPDNLK